MPVIQHQLGIKKMPGALPLRIISTVPSQTELLHDLGLDEEVIGITGFCVHPSHWLKEKTIVGGTKDLQIEKIKSLRPDLIIANKEENVKEQIEELAKDFQVFVSNVKSPEDTIDLISQLGKLTHRNQEAARLNQDIKKAMADLENFRLQGTCSYLIWKDPYMAVSNDTFIQSIIDLTGLKNPISETPDRYPQISLASLAELSPDVILLSSEPYHFSASDLHEIARICPNSLVKLIDGEMMSWYGSRLVKGLKYVKSLRDEIGLVLEGRRNRDQ